MSSSKDRLYSCRHCGAEYIAYPPDDVHSESDVNEISDSIAIPYHCIKCGKENKLH
jgi:DNA-directed RNA polymerase subunit RPC12/RpoP